jgi:hypothetical protein
MINMYRWVILVNFRTLLTRSTLRKPSRGIHEYFQMKYFCGHENEILRYILITRDDVCCNK